MASLKQKTKQKTKTIKVFALKRIFLTVFSERSKKINMATEWKNDGWHTDDVVVACPQVELADWNKVYCGCHRCIHTDFYLKNSIPPNGECLKENAYEQALWELSRKRFEKIPDPYPRVTAEWRANQACATPEQMKVWMSWASPETFEKKDNSKKGWETYKFDPVDMEKDLWKNKFYDAIHMTPKWTAFIEFGKEQYMLYHDYMDFSNSIHTDEDYTKADKKYKELVTHIDRHGHIMWYTLKKNHTLPKHKVVEDAKVGRRQARRLKHDSESNAIMTTSTDVRVKKIVGTQSYTAADEDD